MKIINKIDGKEFKVKSIKGNSIFTEENAIIPVIAIRAGNLEVIHEDGDDPGLQEEIDKSCSIADNEIDSLIKEMTSSPDYDEHRFQAAKAAMQSLIMVTRPMQNGKINIGAITSASIQLADSLLLNLVSSKAEIG